jgi:hypothetical protein
LLDAGLGVIAGVRVTYKIAGFGDSTFPNFRDVELFSVLGEEDDQIIFPLKLALCLSARGPGHRNAK